MDFSLRVNRKAIATDSSPDRDQQFRYISSLRTRFERQGLPIISFDTKKRELVGNFKNHGVKWDRTPVLIRNAARCCFTVGLESSVAEQLGVDKTSVFNWEGKSVCDRNLVNAVDDNHIHGSARRLVQPQAELLSKGDK